MLPIHSLYAEKTMKYMCFLFEMMFESYNEAFLKY